MSEGRVDVRREGPVAVVTLERAAKLNALSAHLENELYAAIRSDPVSTSGAVVITGGRQVFSAGADTGELAAMTTASIAEYYRGSGGVYEDVAALPQPTASAIAGYCFGGGFELALATDFRVADESAVFCLPEVAIELAALPPHAIAFAKRLIDRCVDSDRDTSLLLEQLAYATLNGDEDRA